MNKREKFKTVLRLLIVFLKIGAFTFGGGYAMIPIIQKEVVEKRQWISDKDILDIIAIAESTPGPIAINSATFVGYKIAGFWGSFFATLGVVFPSFTIISVISLVLKIFEQNTVVQYAFNGIQAGVLALIIKALISMYKQCPKGLVSYVLMAASFIVVAVLDLNVLYAIIGCAVAGLISSIIISRRNKNDLS